MKLPVVAILLALCAAPGCLFEWGSVIEYRMRCADQDGLLNQKRLVLQCFMEVVDELGMVVEAEGREGRMDVYIATFPRKDSRAPCVRKDPFFMILIVREFVSIGFRMSTSPPRDPAAVERAAALLATKLTECGLEEGRDYDVRREGVGDHDGWVTRGP